MYGWSGLVQERGKWMKVVVDKFFQVAIMAPKFTANSKAPCQCL